MRILIVKLSSLGDVVHALPVVADILASRPDAVIDWVVEPAFAPVLRRVAGIADVIEMPLRRWRGSGWWRAATHDTTRDEMRTFLRRLRQRRYDAVIDLQGLVKSALVARLAHGPSFGLVNRTEGSSHEWPARWLVTQAIHVEPKSHALDRSRELVVRALGTTNVAAPSFGLRPAPRTECQAALRPDADVVVFAHGSSRDDKLWPEANWIELARRIVAEGGRVALPQADATERNRAQRIADAVGRAVGSAVGPTVAESCEVWPAMDVGALIDRMATTSGVVGVDSGPSHVAVALGLPHVQIYNHPTAWRTGPQRRHGHAHQVSIESRSTPTVDAVWTAWQQVKARRRQAP